MPLPVPTDNTFGNKKNDNWDNEAYELCFIQIEQ